MTQKTIYISTRQLKNGELIYLRGFDTEQLAKNYIHFQEIFSQEKWTYFIVSVPYYRVEQQPQWISVKDKLPEGPEGPIRVLAYFLKIVDPVYFGYDPTDTPYWCNDLLGSDLPVTHWMPLPSSPIKNQ